MTNNHTMDIPNRDQQHGGIQTVGELSQTIKHAIRQQGRNYHLLTHPEREALDMIAHKIARLLSGDANDPDHWRDIAGYAHTIVRLQAQDDEARKAERSADGP